MNGKIFTAFKANGEQTLLEQMEHIQIDFPYSCRAGACMTCAVVVKNGMEFLDQNTGGEKFIDTDEDQFLTCIGGVKTEFANEKDETKVHIVELEIMDDAMVE